MDRYSNNVYIPGHHTIPDDMEQDWVTCHHQVSQNKKSTLNLNPTMTVQNMWKKNTQKVC